MSFSNLFNITGTITDWMLYPSHALTLIPISEEKVYIFSLWIRQRGLASKPHRSIFHHRIISQFNGSDVVSFDLRHSLTPPPHSFFHHLRRRSNNSTFFPQNHPTLTFTLIGCGSSSSLCFPYSTSQRRRWWTQCLRFTFSSSGTFSFSTAIRMHLN